MPLSRPWLPLVACAVLVATDLRGVRAAVCSETKEPAPEVRTLQASTTTPATEAWIVSPDCTVTTYTLDNGDDGPVGALYLYDEGIEQVVSVPSETTVLILGGNLLSRGADFSKATKMRTLGLSVVPPDVRTLVLPPGLASIGFHGRGDMRATSLDGIVLPPALADLSLGNTRVKSLKNVQIPASVKSISITTSPLSSLDFQLPLALEELYIFDIPTSSFARFERQVLPSGLKVLDLNNVGTATFRGIKWPTTLERFNVLNSPIDAFEIRRSDVAIFNKLTDPYAFRATVTQTTCSGSAKLDTVAGVSICVLSDADFEAVYVTPPHSSDDVTIGPDPRSQGGSNSGDLARPAATPSETTDRSSTRQPARRPSHLPDETDESGIPGEVEEEEATDDILDATSSSTGANGSPIARSPRTASNSSLGASTAGSSKSSGLLASLTPSPPGSPIANGSGERASRTSITVIVLACALSCAVGGIVYRMIMKKTQSQDNHTKLVDDSTGGNYTRADTPTITSLDSTEPKASSAAMPTELEALRVAFMSDQDLIRYLLDRVQVGLAIAEGGSGIVHRGSYEGRAVAVKQLPPEAWRDSKLVANFIDEIRLCTRLDHPKIVEFIGVTWSGGRDLAAVSEFMAGGDLKSVLQKYPSSTGSEWASPWTETQLRTKTLIAMDVVEAVVYLHSFSSPIIHRDLKAKNVLLDTSGNAKLSDFGISREASADETMTGDIGTTAWIAPEVLRGDRYSEKADIYSLGVLLVEMDRCTHPYANEAMLMTGSDVVTRHSGDDQATMGIVAHKNTQIAVLVSTGQLRPSPTPQCPEDVKQVVARCVSLEASERPTAMEVFYQLRQVRKTHVS